MSEGGRGIAVRTMDERSSRDGLCAGCRYEAWDDSEIGIAGMPCPSAEGRVEPGSVVWSYELGSFSRRDASDCRGPGLGLCVSGVNFAWVPSTEGVLATSGRRGESSFVL